MVNARFGLRDNPFRLTPDLGVRCDWAAFAAARERLEEGLRSGDKLALIGEPGVGKTLLLRSLARELKDLGAVYLACGRRFSLADLDRALAGARPAILLLDDAHLLEADALGDLLRGAAALALGATPGFAASGLKPFTLAPLAPEEVAPYVHCRLAAAGWSGGELFDAVACERLWQFSQGAARRINNLSSAALFLASQRDVSQVGAELIEAAAAGLSLQPAPAAPVAAPRRRVQAAAVPPSADSPTIMAAFLRERARDATPKPADAAAQSQEKPAEPVAVVSAPPAAPAAPSPQRGLLLPTAEAEAGRRTERPLIAPAVARWAEAEPPPARPARRALPVVLALSLIVAAGIGFVWRLELAPRPDLKIDWAKVQALTSPQAGLAAAPDDSKLAVLVREPRRAETAQTPPIVFPNAAPQEEAPAGPFVSPPAPPPAAAPPAVSPPIISPPVASPTTAEVPPATAVTAPQPQAQPQPELAKVEPTRPEPAPQPESPAPAEPVPQVATAPAQAAAPAPPPAAASAPETPAAAPEGPAAAPPPDHEARIAELLAQARRLALAFALTTPPGQSAYDSYREVLALDRGRREAFEGLDEIAAKYDALAGLARQRDKPALVQLYEGRAAQVRRDRVRLAAEAPAGAR